MQKDSFIHTDLKAVCNNAAKKLAALAMVAAVGGTGLVSSNCLFTASAQTGNGNPTDPGNGQVSEADFNNAIDAFLCDYAKNLLKKLARSYKGNAAVEDGIKRLSQLLQEGQPQRTHRPLRNSVAVIWHAEELLRDPTRWTDTFLEETATDESVQLLPEDVPLGNERVLRQMTLGDAYDDHYGVNWNSVRMSTLTYHRAARRLGRLCATRLRSTPAPDHPRTASFAAEVAAVLDQGPGNTRDARRRYMNAVHDALMLLTELPPSNNGNRGFLLNPGYGPGLWDADEYLGRPGILTVVWNDEEETAWDNGHMHPDDLAAAGGDLDLYCYAGEQDGDEHAGEPVYTVNNENSVTIAPGMNLRLPNGIFAIGSNGRDTVPNSPRAMSPITRNGVMFAFFPHNSK